jgi:hypothetical protein
MIAKLINNNNFRITLANKALEVKNTHSLSVISRLYIEDFKLLLNQSPKK